MKKPQHHRPVRRALIIGAGEAGCMVLRELARHPEMGLQAVALIDDDPAVQGTQVCGLTVAGTTTEIADVAEAHGVSEVIIAMPSQPGAVIHRIISQLQQDAPQLNYSIIPGMYELLSGKVGVNRIRNVEIEDLLGRPPVTLDDASISGYLRGRSVMVTGAGGSIGSELIRQICRYGPRELILFGHGENSIHALERELDRNWPEIPYRSVIGAIQNGSRLEFIFGSMQPEVVFHTAAHKHVPLMELNPEEAIFNNVIGSRNLVNLALKYGVTHFVNVSTDKAVNPTSVMGASKRIVEMVVQEAASRATQGQVFVSVRFGNVLGSRGSVIPVFRSQIAAGGPVTVTHPEVVRYFMTIPEATQLVLQAAALGQNGATFILNMGEPVKIDDLARDLIRLSGFEPDVDIPIVYTGMRPGEKMYEELMTEEEGASNAGHEKIFTAATGELDATGLDATVIRLTNAALTHDRNRIRRVLMDFLPGCQLEVSAEAQPPAADAPVPV